MTFNYDLAVKTLARVEIARLDGRWSQESWGRKTPCGTAFCYAGWTINLSGEDFSWVVLSGGTEVAHSLTDGEDISDRACDLLGIDRSRFCWRDDEADEMWATDEGESDERWNEGHQMPVLFDATNTIEDLYHQVYLWAVEDQPTLTQTDLQAHVKEAVLGLLRLPS